MSKERNWKEEQKTVLGRLFDACFGRSKASEDEIGRDIHWLGTVNKRTEGATRQKAFSIGLSLDPRV